MALLVLMASAMCLPWSFVMGCGGNQGWGMVLLMCEVFVVFLGVPVARTVSWFM